MKLTLALLAGAALVASNAARADAAAGRLDVLGKLENPITSPEDVLWDLQMAGPRQLSLSADSILQSVLAMLYQSGLDEETVLRVAEALEALGPEKKEKFAMDFLYASMQGSTEDGLMWFHDRSVAFSEQEGSQEAAAIVAALIGDIEAPALEPAFGAEQDLPGLFDEMMPRSLGLGSGMGLGSGSGLGSGEDPMPTPSATATADPTASATADPTASATAAADPTASATAAADPTASATAAADPTASTTADPTASATADPTASATATYDPNASPTADPTASATADLTPSATPSHTPSVTPSSSATPSNSVAPSSAPTSAPSATSEPTPSTSGIPKPSAAVSSAPTPLASPYAQLPESLSEDEASPPGSALAANVEQALHFAAPAASDFGELLGQFASAAALDDVTVFAPVNSATQAVLAAVGAQAMVSFADSRPSFWTRYGASESDKHAAIADLVAGHVVNGRRSFHALYTAGSGTSMPSALVGSVELTVEADASAKITYAATNASLLHADLHFDNAVVHLVDTMILSEAAEAALPTGTLIERLAEEPLLRAAKGMLERATSVAAADTEFGRIVAATEDEAMGFELSETFTAFLPTDLALKKYRRQLAYNQRYALFDSASYAGELIKFLSAHICPNAYAYSGYLQAEGGAGLVNRLTNSPMEVIASTAGDVTVGGDSAKVVVTDVAALNGIAHGVTEVLYPVASLASIVAPEYCSFHPALRAPCGAGACTEVADGFTCDCTNSGFEGDSCEFPAIVGACASTPCGANGVCQDGFTAVDFTCLCNAGFAGATCDEDVRQADPTCEDGVLNQDETDVDCGGVCGSTCARGSVCSFDSNCAIDTDVCATGRTGVQSCSAAVKPVGKYVQSSFGLNAGLSPKQFKESPLLGTFTNHMLGVTGAEAIDIKSITQAAATDVRMLRAARALQAGGELNIDFEARLPASTSDADVAAASTAVADNLVPDDPNDGLVGALRQSMPSIARNIQSISADSVALTEEDVDVEQAVAGALVAPSPSPQPTEPEGDTENDTAAIAGGVTASILVLGGVALNFKKIKNRRRNNKADRLDEDGDDEEEEFVSLAGANPMRA